MLAVLAIALYVSVFLSIGLAILLGYRGVERRSLLELSRALYPIAVVAVCGLELDRIEYKLTGINGTENFWIIASVILVLIVTILRTIAVVALDKNGHVG
jgi:hypothetical protein